MSAPNLVIQALFCVKLSSGQGLLYRPTDLPTDMSKAIYPHFVEGGINMDEMVGFVFQTLENIVAKGEKCW